MEWLIALGISAVVGLIGGSAISGVTEALNEDEAYRDYQRKQQYLTTELENALKENQDTYDEQKKQANLDADKSDLLTTKDENFLSNDFNLGIDALGANQMQQGMNYNLAAMQSGQQTGNELAQMSNSGIRAGSSLAQAVDLEASTNAAQLQLQQDTQRRSDNNQLSSLIGNLNKGENDIWNARDAADRSRASWEEGGYNYNMNQIKREAMQNNYALQMKKWKDEWEEYNSLGNIAKRFISGAWNYGSSLSSQTYQLTSLFV